jgi:putative ATP-binding cassette transporter
LREVLAYPSAVAAFEAGACINALERLGLERLSPMLDEPHRWDAVLSDGEHQSLAFARALLHAPAWLIIDEAIDALEADALPKVIDLFSKEFQHTGVLYIGRAGAHDGLFGRTVHLVDVDPADSLKSARLAPRVAASAT